MRSPPQERQPTGDGDLLPALLSSPSPSSAFAMTARRTRPQRHTVGDRLLHGGGLLRRQGAGPRRRPGPRRRHLEGVQQGDVSADQSMTMANLCRIHCIYPDVDGITSPTHRMKGTTCSSTVSYSSSHVYWHAC